MIGDIVYRDTVNPAHRETYTSGYYNPKHRVAGHPWCHTQDVNHLSVNLTREVFRYYSPDIAALIVLADWQGDACAICGFEHKLIKEHDHDSDFIRGLVCMSCNAHESYPKNHRSGVEDEPDADLTIRRYLRMPPMRMLGLTAHYSHTRNIDPVALVREWYRQDAIKRVAKLTPRPEPIVIPSVRV